MMEPQRSSSPCFGASFSNFICTQKAILLITEIIFCIVVLCCLKGVAYYYLSEAELTLGIFFFIIYGTSLQDYIPWVIWPWCDFLRSFVAAIIYLINSIPSLAVRGNHNEAIEGIMGLFAVCLFGYDAGTSFPPKQ